jgi:hypothetical protein
MRRYNPWVIYNGKLTIKDSALSLIESRKGGYLFPEKVIKEKIDKGEIIRVLNSSKGKYGLLDYNSLRPTLKEILIRKHGLPPKIINK